MKQKPARSSFASLLQEEVQFKEEEYPKVTVIIPTLNASALITITMENVVNQDYPNLEIILIDSGSIDRTIEIVKSFKDKRIKIYSVSEYSRYEMLNHGISHAEGVYINFLFPGDFFISNQSVRWMMNLALQNNEPHLVYGGSLLNTGKTDVKILYRPLTLDLLKSGKQPTSIQACFFKNEVFKILGKLDSNLSLRGGYDLFCRFMLNGTLSFQSTTRVITDYDIRSVTRNMVVTHFFETMSIINRYFGLWAVFTWLGKQSDVTRYLKLWFRSVRVAFLGKAG
jgi:glycosyltransferase involved in cell wall biosynthesis